MQTEIQVKVSVSALLAILATIAMLAPALLYADDLVSAVAKAKPSVVGIGIYDPVGAPRNSLMGTGFSIGDGKTIVTNYHVVQEEVGVNDRKQRVVFIGSGRQVKHAKAELIGVDPAHDLALLRIAVRVPPLELASDQVVPDGTAIAFTGFPIGSVLGLYPATHTGIIAAYTPVVIPSLNANQLSIEMLKRLRDPFFIYQLDATAYPGNSGSPLYELSESKVIAVINKVFVKSTKEAVLSDPSGITYAIPVHYVRKLASESGITL